MGRECSEARQADKSRAEPRADVELQNGPEDDIRLGGCFASIRELSLICLCVPQYGANPLDSRRSRDITYENFGRVYVVPPVYAVNPTTLTPNNVGSTSA